ncbi:MAG: hypothetical protein IJ520_00525, partial [Synergistaceae bacterium]|nr:hypothetical protein [Synergistaceae bacterium]
MAVKKTLTEQELIDVVNEFKTLTDEKAKRRLLNSLSAYDVKAFARLEKVYIPMGWNKKADIIDVIIEKVKTAAPTNENSDVKTEVNTMTRNYNSNINSANVFEVLSAAAGTKAQLELLNGLTVKELRALAKGLSIKLSSGTTRKFDIEVAIVEGVSKMAVSRLENAMLGTQKK